MFRLRTIAATFLFFVFWSCRSDPAPKGFYVLKNDIMDKEYNVVTVDDVTANGAVTNFRTTLRPGDEQKIPYRHVTAMRFTRQYEKFTRIYIVHCPVDSEAGVTIKLIDVHLNRLGGGCTLTKRGERRKGRAIDWEP